MWLLAFRPFPQTGNASCTPCRGVEGRAAIFDDQQRLCFALMLAGIKKFDHERGHNVSIPGVES